MGQVKITMEKNRIDVQVFELTPKNFTKNGHLSKRAKPIIDDQECQVLGGAEDIAVTIRQRLPGRITLTESPYVFTHIKLETIDRAGVVRNFIVFEHVWVNGTRLITSPTKLLEALKPNL